MPVFPDRAAFRWHPTASREGAEYRNLPLAGQAPLRSAGNAASSSRSRAPREASIAKDRGKPASSGADAAELKSADRPITALDPSCQRRRALQHTVPDAGGRAMVLLDSGPARSASPNDPCRVAHFVHLLASRGGIHARRRTQPRAASWTRTGAAMAAARPRRRPSGAKRNRRSRSRLRPTRSPASSSASERPSLTTTNGRSEPRSK